MTDLPPIEKLRWQCRRGMLELDYLFEQFLEQEYPSLDEENQALFVELLTHNDQDLQQWILNRTSPADSRLLKIIDRIQSGLPGPA